MVRLPLAPTPTVSPSVTSVMVRPGCTLSPPETVPLLPLTVRGLTDTTRRSPAGSVAVRRTVLTTLVRAGSEREPTVPFNSSVRIRPAVCVTGPVVDSVSMLAARVWPAANRMPPVPAVSVIPSGAEALPFSVTEPAVPAVSSTLPLAPMFAPALVTRLPPAVAAVSPPWLFTPPDTVSVPPATRLSAPFANRPPDTARLPVVVRTTSAVEFTAARARTALPALASVRPVIVPESVLASSGAVCVTAPVVDSAMVGKRVRSICVSTFTWPKLTPPPPVVASRSVDVLTRARSAGRYTAVFPVTVGLAVTWMPVPDERGDSVTMPPGASMAKAPAAARRSRA